MSQKPEELLDSQNPTLAWNLLSERVEALVAAWESAGEPPDWPISCRPAPPALRQWPWSS